MIDDFHLFDHDADDPDPVVDADIALVAAYLSRELSPMQIAAVRDRMTTDAAFREKVQPLIQGWSLPGTWDPAAVHAASVRDEQANSLTTAEIDAGWQRHLEASRTHRAGRTSATFDSPATLSPTWKRVMTRIAAGIAIVILPMIAVAQFAIYAANHVGAPGHGIAQAIVPPSLRSPVRDLEMMPTPGRVRIDDAPPGRQVSVVSTAQQSVPVVDLAPTARSTRVFKGVVGVKEVNGRLLVNDADTKQLLLLEADLASGTAVLDSVKGTPTSYEGGSGLMDIGGGPPLLPFLGDSSLLFDMSTRSARVLDGRGHVVRAIAPIGASLPDMDHFMRYPGAVDAKGRLLSLESPSRDVRVSVPRSGLLASVEVSSGSGGRSGEGGGSGPVVVRSNDRPDSLPLLRLDFERRRYDTATFVFRPPDGNGFSHPYGGGKLVVSYAKDGKPQSARQVVNPLYPIDEWAGLSDGTIGVVRGRDYHVDWIHTDGSRTSSPKLPFEWTRVTDADKQRLIDSTRAFIDSAEADVAALVAWRQARRNASLPAADSSDPRSRQIVDKAARIVPLTFVPLSEIADYYPPVRIGSVLGDRDGNLWILPRMTSLSTKGELVYDVVNEKEGLVRRVRLPLGRSIVGFGRGGLVFLQAGDLKTGFVLERASVSR